LYKYKLALVRLAKQAPKKTSFACCPFANKNFVFISKAREQSNPEASFASKGN